MDPGQRIHVLQTAGEAVGVAGRVHHLGVAEHLDREKPFVIEKRIGPALLLFVHYVDSLPEKEKIDVPLVVAVVGGQHAVVLPGVGAVAEIGRILIRAVHEARCLHEHRVGVHVDVVHEGEFLLLGLVGAVAAFDYLAVLVTHGSAALEDGDGVLGVVVEVAGAEDVLVLVLQLDHRPAELSHILVDDIVGRLAGEGRLVLDQLDVSVGLDDTGVGVPERGVAEEVGVVVEKTGGADDLPVMVAVLLQKLGRLSAYQRDEAVRPVFLLAGSRHGRRQKRQGQQQSSAEGPHHQSFLNFSAHSGRSNWQSEYIGSMTILVDLILSERNLSIAFICMSIRTCCMIWL